LLLQQVDLLAHFLGAGLSIRHTAEADGRCTHDESANPRNGLKFHIHGCLLKIFKAFTAQTQHENLLYLLGASGAAAALDQSQYFHFYVSAAGIFTE
jgi:hypothetical protein